MTTRRTGLAAVLAALLVPAAVGAGSAEQDGPPNFQSDAEHARVDRERGAILCSWLLLTELKAIHRQCHADESAEVAAALDRSLERFHAFIVANSAETRDRLESAVAHRLSEAQDEAEARVEGNICVGDGEEFYRFFTRNGAAGIDAWTEHALAVPRPPVLNPCL